MGRDDDDRPRRSWKEIDSTRDGSRGGGGRADRRDDDRKGPGYSKYKSDLHRLFDVGMAQGHVEHIMSKAPAAGGDGEEGGGEGAGESRADLVRKCRLAESAADLFAAVDELLTTGGLPKDLDLLLRVCDHPDEAVATEALEGIEHLTQRAPLDRKAAFLQRLYTLEQTAQTEPLRDVVNRLIEQLS